MREYPFNCMQFMDDFKPYQWRERNAYMIPSVFFLFCSYSLVDCKQLYLDYLYGKNYYIFFGCVYHQKWWCGVPTFFCISMNMSDWECGYGGEVW